MVQLVSILIKVTVILFGSYLYDIFSFASSEIFVAKENRQD